MAKPVSPPPPAPPRAASSPGQSSKPLRRYTSLPVLLDTLLNRRLTLVSYSTWKDANDRRSMEVYQETMHYAFVGAICLTEAPETFHHWQVFAGDLPRDTTTLGSGLTLGTTAAATGAIVIGTNGFPAFIATAAPQSGTNPIGPNGFPQPLTNGPQAGIQPIGPDGFPIATVAPFSQTGMTRAGTPRDGSLPVTAPTTAPAATGVSASATTAATAIGTTSATSASTTASSASPR